MQLVEVTATFRLDPNRIRCGFGRLLKRLGRHYGVECVTLSGGQPVTTEPQKLPLPSRDRGGQHNGSQSRSAAGMWRG